MCALLIPVASLVGAQALGTCGLQSKDSVGVAHGLSFPLSMWDLPGPGIEPVSPASAGRLLSTASPAKSFRQLFIIHSPPS